MFMCVNYRSEVKGSCAPIAVEKCARYIVRTVRASAALLFSVPLTKSQTFMFIAADSTNGVHTCVAMHRANMQTSRLHDVATIAAHSLYVGLKALFRPMTVMVPDLVLICENMLMAEGFIEAKVNSLHVQVRLALSANIIMETPTYCLLVGHSFCNFCSCRFFFKRHFFLIFALFNTKRIPSI